MKKREREIQMIHCQICPFDRYIEKCHIVPRRLGGGDNSLNILWLCPNHHKLFDWGLLNTEEVSMIEKYLMAATELYSENIKVIEYLYFQLGLRSDPPAYMKKLRKSYKQKISNSFF